MYPGHLLQLQSDGSVQPHQTAGARVPIRVAVEDAYQGSVKSTPYSANNVTMFQLCAKGDLMLMQVAGGQNVAEGDELMSSGDGTLSSLFGPVLYNITASSTNLTNTNTETTFSNGTYSISANQLRAGDVIRISGTAEVLVQNSTNTNRFKVKLGSSVLADSTALNLAANADVNFDVAVTVRTIGAAGTFVSQGSINETQANLDSTAINTQIANNVTVTDTQSAISVNNVAVLTQLKITVERSGGIHPLFEAAEAINNAGGTSSTPGAWIRVTVL
jgi:hypothetical protein